MDWRTVLEIMVAVIGAVLVLEAFGRVLILARSSSETTP